MYFDFFHRNIMAWIEASGVWPVVVRYTWSTTNAASSQAIIVCTGASMTNPLAAAPYPVSAAHPDQRAVLNCAGSSTSNRPK